LKRAIEEVLIARHNEVLQNEFQAMLRDELEEIARGASVNHEYLFEY
jgi:hypothetical protein